MGKFAKYIMLWSGIILLSYYAGLVQNNALITVLLNPQNMTTTEWFSLLILGFGAVASIVVGVVTRNYELGVMGAIVPSIVYYMWDFLQLYVVMRAENVILANLVFGPMVFLFLFTALEFWRGRD